MSQVDALQALVAARYRRPAALSNQGCCFADEELDQILAQPDEQLTGTDYQVLLATSRCTGTYEELVWFVPHALRLWQRNEEEAADCRASLVHFLSCELVRLRDDGLADPAANCLRELFAGWTRDFRVVHFDKTACLIKGIYRDYYDLVPHGDMLTETLDDLLRYRAFASLAEEIVESLAQLPGNPARSAWFLHYACHARSRYLEWQQDPSKEAAFVSDLGFAGPAGVEAGRSQPPVFTASARITTLVNDANLLAAHWQRIEPVLVIQHPAETYWRDIRETLIAPDADPSRLSEAEPTRFLAEEALPYEPPPHEEPPVRSHPEAADWPQFKDSLEQFVGAMEQFVQLFPMAAEELSEELDRQKARVAGLGKRYRGRLGDSDEEITFRVLYVQGNFVHADSDAGPVRIHKRDFAAGLEAGRILELPD